MPQTFISANGWVKLPVACHLGEIDTLLANGRFSPGYKRLLEVYVRIPSVLRPCYAEDRF
jgi:hypothetical protein